MATNLDQAIESKAMGFGECLSSPLPPPPKKARVENEADELEVAYKKFAEEFEQSEGFDIQTFPDVTKFIGGMIKVPFDLEEIYSADFCTELFYKFGCIFSLKYAIFKENQKQKKKLVLDKIIKSNYESGDLYYTTFLAKDLDTGETKIYQTKVWFHLINAETEVLIFRERADQALQPGEDTQGVDMEIFPNLPAPGDALRSANLDINARGEDSYYRCLFYLSIRFALRTMDERENKDRMLWKVTEGFYGADLSFHTTFIVRDMDMDDEDKTYKIEVHFNTMSGELELRGFEAIVKNA